MSTSREYLLDLIKKLVDEKVQFVVCGGVAAVLHGVQRLTVDLDLSLLMTEDNLKHFLSVMAQENMVPRAPIPPEAILDPQVLQAIVKDKGAIVFTFIDPENAYKQVDFFLTPDLSYESLVTETLEVELEEGYGLKILTIDKLIEMKRSVTPLREKDRYDIAELTRLKGRQP